MVCLFSVPLWAEDPSVASRIDRLRTALAAHDKAATADVLESLGGVHGAAALRSTLSLSLRARMAAAHLRWAQQMHPSDPAQRYTAIDAILIEYDNLIAEAKALNPPDPGILRPLREDKVSALLARQRWDDVIAEVKQLRADYGVVRPYIRKAEADALLAKRQPKEACAAYQDVLKADPQNPEARYGLFYAQVDSEDFDGAFATIDAIGASLRPKRWYAGSPAPQPNGDWLSAIITAGAVRSWGDRPDDAWARLEPLASSAPALGYLRSALGAAAAGQGWPHRAETEVRSAATLAPDDLGIQIELADSAMRRREWPEARRRIRELQRLYPDNSGVQRLVRDLASHDKFELHSFVNGRIDSEMNPAFPGTGYDGGFRLYSPPVAERWRAIAEIGRATADVPESYIFRDRMGGGLDLRLPDFTFEGLGWSNRGTLDSAGGGGWMYWTPTDHWSFGAGGEYFAQDTPLRALFYGTRANAVDASTQYSWNKLQSVEAAARGWSFTDDNRRMFGRLTGHQPILDLTTLDVVLDPQVTSSFNKMNNVPYFSPLADLNATLGVHADHRLWRHYEKSWSQNVAFNTGLYAQRRFKPDVSGELSYGQSYRWDPDTEVRAGVAFGRSVYDGDAEWPLTGFMEWVQRL